jgi:hypothetical protein
MSYLKYSLFILFALFQIHIILTPDFRVEAGETAQEHVDLTL